MPEENGLVLIAGIARDNLGRMVIGKDGDIPWRSVREDLKRFRKLTINHGVIMGRRTAEELIGKGVFPLVGRKNIVLTSTADFGKVYGENAISAGSLEFAIALAQGVNKDRTAYVIGGGSVYDATIGMATRLELTEFPWIVEGDTYFPQFGDEWGVVAEEERLGGYAFRTYARA
ncbi:MAG: dihydrofolate reductase [Candidatus Pacearchaeota archaeon]|nr:dihydrofolate reductase [Candidatus Pacearchaeota archaeon]